MQNPLIILGTAHLSTTPGKNSPDGKLVEAEYSRQRVEGIRRRLVAKGFEVEVDYTPLTPSAAMRSITPKLEQQRELAERCRIVNELCRQRGAENCLYVSVHVNAAGADGKWHTAGGWCAYTSTGKTRADALAECLYDAAEQQLSGYAGAMDEGKKQGLYGKTQRAVRIDKTDGDKDLEAGFYVLRHTACPAVLTENLFQDCRTDVDFLLSPDGIEAIEMLHVEGLEAFVSSER